MVNLDCKQNSLLSNLTISNDIVDQIKMAQETDEERQRFLTSLNSIKKGGNEMMRFEGYMFLRMWSLGIKSCMEHIIQSTPYTWALPRCIKV